MKSPTQRTWEEHCRQWVHPAAVAGCKLVAAHPKKVWHYKSRRFAVIFDEGTQWLVRLGEAKPMKNNLEAKPHENLGPLASSDHRSAEAIRQALASFNDLSRPSGSWIGAGSSVPRPPQPAPVWGGFGSHAFQAQSFTPPQGVPVLRQAVSP
jgi:hypothetical protein